MKDRADASQPGGPSSRGRRISLTLGRFGFYLRMLFVKLRKSGKPKSTTKTYLQKNHASDPDQSRQIGENNLRIPDPRTRNLTSARWRIAI